ncbi:MAG: hypothetical protein ABWZ77_02160 [Naasia sp.]
MRKDIAADYRRRGARVSKDVVRELITPRRLGVLVGIALLVLLLGGVGVAAVSADELLVAPVFVAYVLIVIAAAEMSVWACLTVWFRRDRRGQHPLTFLETGELGRVTDADGTVEIPAERRQSVLRATEFAAPRHAAAAAAGFVLAVTGLTVGAAGALVAIDRFSSGALALVLGLQGVVGLVNVRQSLVFAGHNDRARELALEAPTASDPAP